jgi:hypothetical protein
MDLCSVQPLEDGNPFECVGGREVWHPDWRGRTDVGINAKFIDEAVTLVWENEKVSSPLGRPYVTHITYSVFGRLEWE